MIKSVIHRHSISANLILGINLYFVVMFYYSDISSDNSQTSGPTQTIFSYYILQSRCNVFFHIKYSAPNIFPYLFILNINILLFTLIFFCFVCKFYSGCKLICEHNTNHISE